MPLGSVFVEVEDVKGTVAASDFATAVMGTVPPVENFDDLDPMSLQTKRMGDLNPSVLARLDLDAHVSASAAGQALSKRCRHDVESGSRGLLLNDAVVSWLPTMWLQAGAAANEDEILHVLK